MDSILLEKTYNCYLTYLDKLAYGKTDQDTCLLYGAIQLMSNDISSSRYSQFFSENLMCPDRFILNITEDMDKHILWVLDTSAQLGQFNWNDIPAPADGLYEFTTNSVASFNFLYVAVPQNTKITIYNELNMVIYDSELPVNANNQLFHLVGTKTLDNGTINDVYRKDDVFNSTHSVMFKIKLS